ncbi:MAG: serine O-acetyltransferase [Pirellulaceae bacterium]
MVSDRYMVSHPGGESHAAPSEESVPQVAVRRFADRARNQRRLFVEFISLVREDWQANGRDWTLPGFRALAVQRFGVWQSNLAFKPARVMLGWLYTFLYRYVRNHYGIELRRSTRIGRRFIIAHQGGIVIHPRAVIGDDCLVRQNTTIGAVSANSVALAPQLGNRVELGCGAAVLGPVRIGDDTRIGANVVVMTDIPPGSTVVAAPPRVIRMPQRPESSADNGI